VSAETEASERGGVEPMTCPCCGSRLIYTTDTAGFGSQVVLDRRCPECEHRDTIIARAPAAAAWYRRDTRLLAELAGIADALAAGLEIEPAQR
jgi:DNA-directed RNA polymerase subunit RPC12/RpoP